MYQKIPVQIDLPKPVEGTTEYVKYGLGSGPSFRGIKYTDFTNEGTEDDLAIQELWNLVPSMYRRDFQISLMSINRDILPHTDSNVRTVINFYLKAGGYVTSFCEPLARAKSFQLPTQTNGVVYDFNDVSANESFVAEDGDLYVLDVTKLHCVHSGKGDRVAINLGTPLPYNDVIEMMIKAEV